MRDTSGIAPAWRGNPAWNFRRFFRPAHTVGAAPPHARMPALLFWPVPFPPAHRGGFSPGFLFSVLCFRFPDGPEPSCRPGSVRSPFSSSKAEPAGRSFHRMLRLEEACFRSIRNILFLSCSPSLYSLVLSDFPFSSLTLPFFPSRKRRYSAARPISSRFRE